MLPDRSLTAAGLAVTELTAAGHPLCYTQDVIVPGFLHLACASSMPMTRPRRGAGSTR